MPPKIKRKPRTPAPAPIRTDNPTTPKPVTRKPVNSGEVDGRFRLTLGDPVTVERLKPGMSVVVSGELCNVVSVKKARKLEERFVIAFGGHRFKGSFSQVANAGDVFYRSIKDRTQE